MKRIHVTYYAMLRERRGCGMEIVETSAATPSLLYEELRAKHDLKLPQSALKVSINHLIQSWDCELSDGDQIGFLPPVSGGRECST